MQEYFKILGVSENASDEEIDNAYYALKEKYSKDRFLEGNAGNEAAKNLTKLETAYAEIKEYRFKKSDYFGNESYDYSNVEKLIKDGKIADAQRELDNVSDRDAEWHYLQAVVFYKKNWMSESKKQLEIAMSIDPHNEKYSDAFAKLDQKMKFNENQFHSGNVNYGSNAETEKQMGGSGASDCLTFCATWCCMDLMCSMCCR